MNIGDVVKKYESGSSGPGTISTGKGDPGGKSYGTYQLSLNTGTLNAYLKSSKYKTKFSGMKLGSAKFDTMWKYLAASDTDSFNDDQHAFISRTHYKPARDYADTLNLPSTNAINEVIWSMSVQHGKVKTILKNVYDRADNTMTEREIVDLLYDERCAYIGRIGLSHNLIKNLLTRYKNEKLDIITNFGL